MPPYCCPICGFTRLEEVLASISVTAHCPQGDHEVGGLRAYECVFNRHIFFIRARDLEAYDPGAKIPA